MLLNSNSFKPILKNKKKASWLILVVCFFLFLSSDLQANLEDFFFTPQRRRLLFVEDYYALYRKNLKPDTASLLANIHYLQLGLSAAEKNLWWGHPVRSRAYARYDWVNPPNPSNHPLGEKTLLYPALYAKYKELMKMRISLLLTRNYLSFGARYDRVHLYWFHAQDYEDLPYIQREKPEHYLKKSFRIAKRSYESAQKYWEKTKELVQLLWEGEYQSDEFSDSVPYRTLDLVGPELDRMENEVYEIYHQNDERYKKELLDFPFPEAYPKFNYDKVLEERLENINQKTQQLDQLIQEYQKLLEQK